MESIEFPVTFDLRIIYENGKAPAVNADLLAVFARQAVPCAAITPTEGKEGAKYARLGARVTFKSVEQLRATYAELGALPYVKSLI